MNAHSKSAHLRPLGLCAIALLMGALSVHAQSPSPASGIAPSLASAASATAPARPATGPASIATAPRWGDGVLEREFLIKLRTFLETDPFDFKAFEAAFVVPLIPSPPTETYSDGSWSIGSERYVQPFGPTFNNRSRGGVLWAFNPRHDSYNLRMEFVKMPPVGKRDGDGLPCLTPEMIKEVFSTGWVGTTTYTDFAPAYPGRLPYPIPSNQIFRWQPDTLEQVRLVYRLNEICVPGLTVGFKKLPPHPATR